MVEGSPNEVGASAAIGLESTHALDVGTGDGKVDHREDRHAEHEGDEAVPQPSPLAGFGLPKPSAIDAPSGRVVTSANQKENTAFQ